MRIPIYQCFICFIFVLTALFFSAAEDAAAGERDEFASRFLANYVTSFYNTGSNGFPGDEANAVLQTRDGYMWFGGYNGLFRYDGAKFTQWNAVTPNGFRSSNIRSLYEDSRGVLWIGTNDRGIVAYQNGKFTAYGKTDGAPSNNIRDIAEGPDGKIYCGTSDGLFYLDAERKITAVELDTPIQPYIISLFCDAQDNVFVLFNSGELFVRTRQGRTVQFPAVRIGAAARVSGGRIVAGTQNGDILISAFDGSSFITSAMLRTPLEIPSAVYEDSNGFVWITSETGTGFLDADENYHNVGDPSGAGFYTDVYEDYQNGYWFTGSKGGVVKLTKSAFYEYPFESGTTNAILMDGGKTYVGTDDGLFIFDRDGKPVSTDFAKTITSRVRGIFRDSRGNIWICMYSGFGVIRYTPRTNEFKNWLPEDGLISDKTRCVAELPNGVIAVGTGGGVSFIKGDEVVSANEAFDTDTDKTIDLPDITVLSIVCAADGILYLGTDGNGVYAVGKNGTTHYQEEDGLTGGVVLRMAANLKPESEKSGVWVASSPGLCYIGEDKKVTAIEKIPPYTFLDVLPCGDDLILLTSSAIMRAKADSLLDPALPFEPVTVDKTSGLTASISANAWNLITEDGSLYFCSSSGINIYNFEKEITSFVPYAGISKINVDGTDYTDFKKGVVIPSGATRLTLDFAYLSFGLLDEAGLRYMLAGQDSAPQSLSKNDSLQVSYTNLEGGRYTLQVWTEDSGGNRGNFLEVPIRKQRKLSERAYVWVLAAAFAALLIVLLAAAFFRHKSRRLYAKHREYRTIISQALNAITKAIDAKDAYTRGHSARVAAYSVEIARRMGMDEDFIENLYYIGLLHDVGKIGVPNEILNKPDKLTQKEYEVMKQHPRIGQEILKDITTIKNLTAGATEHHERWDGRGYYQGLAREGISLEGRIIAAADTYDAMSSDRSYRKKLSKEAILAEFLSFRESQFDPTVTDVVIDLIRRDELSLLDVNHIIDQINEGTMC